MWTGQSIDRWLKHSWRTDLWLHIQKTHTLTHRLQLFYLNSWTSHIPAQKVNSCRLCCITHEEVEWGNTTVTIYSLLKHAFLQTLSTESDYMMKFVYLKKLILCMHTHIHTHTRLSFQMSIKIHVENAWFDLLCSAAVCACMRVRNVMRGLYTTPPLILHQRWLKGMQSWNNM